MSKMLHACMPGSSAVAGTSAPATINELLHLTMCQYVRPMITRHEVAVSVFRGNSLLALIERHATGRPMLGFQPLIGLYQIGVC